VPRGTLEKQNPSVPRKTLKKKQSPSVPRGTLEKQNPSMPSRTQKKTKVQVWQGEHLEKKFQVCQGKHLKNKVQVCQGEHLKKKQSSSVLRGTLEKKTKFKCAKGNT